MAQGKADSTLRLLAGLETGVLGGLISFVWLSTFCVFYNERLYFAGNLIGSTVLGQQALSLGLGKATLAGVALHLIVCGVLGLVQGFALRGALLRSHGAAMLLGLSLALLLFGVARRVNPMLWIESPRLSLFLSCLVFGVCLSRFPNFYGVLDPPAAPPALQEAAPLLGEPTQGSAEPKLLEPPAAAETAVEAPVVHHEPPAAE